MTRGAAVLCALAAGTTCASLPGFGQAQPPAQGGAPSQPKLPTREEDKSEALAQEAKQLFEAGRIAYRQGRYENALEHFERAYELSGEPELLYNIGAAADRLRRNERALHALQRFLDEVPDTPDREAVRARIRILKDVVAKEQQRRRAQEASQSSTGDTNAPNQMRVLALLHVGFLGKLDFDDSDLEDPDLAPTVGFELRFDAPVHRFVAVGGLIRFGFINVQDTGGMDIKRSLLIDLDPFVKGRYPIDLTFGYVAPFVLAQGGMTVDRISDEVRQQFSSFVSNVDQVGLGWNIGLFAGAELGVLQRGIVVAEMGWLRHDVAHDVQIFGSQDTVNATTNQWVIQLGGGVRF